MAHHKGLTQPRACTSDGLGAAYRFVLDRHGHAANIHAPACRLLARSSRGRASAARPAAAVAWHPRKQWLAAAEGLDAVRLLDYAPPPGAAAPRAQPFAPETRVALQHEQQRQVQPHASPMDTSAKADTSLHAVDVVATHGHTHGQRGPSAASCPNCAAFLAHDEWSASAQVTAIAWRPHGGMMLAVACANGICLWTLSRGLARHVAADFAKLGRLFSLPYYVPVCFCIRSQDL